jgi:hypothetical protein
MKAVFLSASIPDPKRDAKYFETGDVIAIRDAVIALTTVALQRGVLVLGGHPAITPLVRLVADRTKSFENVRLFQSKFFQDKYIEDIQRFRYIEIDPVPGDREESLREMREAMINSENLSVAFFVGGMDGVEKEYAKVKEMRPDIPRYPVATTGGAAQLLWPQELESTSELPPFLQQTRRVQLEKLRTKTSYTGLFTELLDDTEPAAQYARL